MNYEKVAAATDMVRTYHHKHRFGIIGKLLDRDEMTFGEIVEDTGLHESYISEQMDILQKDGFVDYGDYEDEESFSPNHSFLNKLNRAVRNFTGG